VRVLDAGVDSLYWTARAPVAAWFADASSARTAAKVEGRPFPWRDVRGYALDALPHGRGVYPFAAQCAEFELRMTDAERIPTAYVQLRSKFIRSVGVERAVAESEAVVAEIAGSVGALKATRIDAYVDFADFRLRGADRVAFHTRAEVAAFFEGGDEDWLPSVRIGAKALKLRAYDKGRQLRRLGEPRPLAWGDFAGIGTRVEVEARSVALRKFRIDRVAEAIASYGDVWRYATTRFVVLRVPGDGPKRSWAVRDEWRAVQEAGGQRFPAIGLIPFAQVKGELARVLQGVYGGLLSIGAYRDCRDLSAVIDGLRAELRSVERGRDFAKEVERRRRRLPRAVRERGSA
jgi:hypothetical protein